MSIAVQPQPLSENANADQTQDGSGNRHPSADAKPQSSGWLFSPVVDGLVVANLLWPIFAIATGYLVGNPFGDKLGFLIAYFLIMPHRWITLSLVFLDPVKFKGNSRNFLIVAGTIVGVVCLTQLSLGALTLMLAIDLIWNAWHFAAQHAGIARIYDRMAHPNSKSTGMADKIVLRTLIMFAIFRVAAHALPEVDSGRQWLAWMPMIMNPLAVLDWFIIALPVGLLIRSLMQFNSASWGRVSYLASITSMYCLMILGIRYDMLWLAIGCAAGATYFHSVEYLAIVTWYVKKNKSLRETKPFCYFIPRWAVALVTFMAACFLSAMMFEHHYLHAWVFLNVIVSFMHYAYDGMIWKRPKQKSAPA